ncbi:MAG: hypothetical protein Q4B43_03345 [Bacteroidota bacterium]|nr:hypothetical protein [Bacteroidota bacterium]
MIYKFRAILDTEEDVFRDIAIEDTDNLEDLHNSISNAFGFDGTEMASFYTCDNKWNQDEEIPLFDTGDEPGEQSTMKDFVLRDILDKEKTKIIYVYDFFNMHTFLVELAAIENPESGASYPMVLFAHGQVSDSDSKMFEPDFLEEEEQYYDFEDEIDEDDFNSFDDLDNFNDFGYDDQYHY